MTVNSRIFQSSHNQLVKLTMPQHLDESTVQTTKPKVQTKSSTTSHIQLPMASENLSWPELDKTSSSLSTESESEADLSAIFRRRIDPVEEEEENDMFSLKRANPVYDSDDEEYMYSPPKRHRKNAPMSLSMEQQLSETTDAFSTIIFRST